MKTIKSLALACVAAGIVSAAQADITSTSLYDMKGLRGDIIPARALLKADGNPFANQSVTFFWCSDARPWTYLGQSRTNTAGVASVPFAIPRSVSDDNVYILATYAGFQGIGIPYTSSYDIRRVRIGVR